jgi:predicted nucleotidyltransferase
MSPYAEYIEAWKSRDAAIIERTSQIQRELWEKLPMLSRLLKSLGAEDVIVFGSLTEGDFKINSDLDLAVKGLPAKKYLEAIRTIEKILSPAGVDFDLIFYENAFPWIKDKIDKGKQI